MNEQLSFDYLGIFDEQFAVFPENYRADRADMQFDLEANFGADYSMRRVKITTTVDVAHAEGERYLRCGISCIFQINEDSWNARLQKDGESVLLEENAYIHFAAFTVSTLRGVLHVRQQGSPVRAMLTPVNVIPLVKLIPPEERILRPLNRNDQTGA